MTQIRDGANFTKGRVIVRGKTVNRSASKKADFLFSYEPNLPLAVLEAMGRFILESSERNSNRVILDLVLK